MSRPRFVFLLEEGEPVGARLARVCTQALADGPMGQRVRGDFYREFLECEGKCSLSGGRDISTVETSCGVFLRSALAWALAVSGPGKVGGPLLENWVPWTFAHESWSWANDPDVEPEVGAICYWDYNRATTKSGHVGLLVQGAGHFWETAQGGGNLLPGEAAAHDLDAAGVKAANGSMCRMIPERDIYVDKLGRKLLGWFRPELMGMPEY